MHYRNLGVHGLVLSSLGLDFRARGLADLARGEARERLGEAVDAGVNYLHSRTAFSDAQAQQLLGELIGDLHLMRDQYVLGVQIGGSRSAQVRPTQQGLSRKSVREACDQTLRRLRVDYLDLVLCEPSAGHTPLEEIAEAMGQLLRQGKLLYWGMAGWDIEMSDALRACCDPIRDGGPAALQAVSMASLEVGDGRHQTPGHIVDPPWPSAGDGAQVRATLAGLLAVPAVTTVLVPPQRQDVLAGWQTMAR